MMADTFYKIASVTVGAGGASSIDFTSIPSTYTDLVIKLSTRWAVADLDTSISFNGSTTSFTARRLYGSGSAVASDTRARTAGLADSSGYTASTFANSEIYIPNYAGSNNKSYSVDSVTENNGTVSYALLAAGLWSNTAAITSITLSESTNTFAQYSTATLYGIKNS